MKRQTPLVYLALAAAGGTLAEVEDSRAGHGLREYGRQMFKPPCAFACRYAIAGATLNCSTVKSDGGMGRGVIMTGAECYATDDAFLQTLAFCISSKCQDVAAWRLEKYWQDYVADVAKRRSKVRPKETYQQALSKVNGFPTMVYNETEPLNQTSVVSDQLWFATYNTQRVFEDQESMQKQYGLFIVMSGIAIPLIFSVLHLLPFPVGWRSRFNAWIIYPPLFGDYHDTPVFFGLARMPTRGQVLFVIYFLSINIVVSLVNYEYADPNIWHPGDQTRWMCMLISNRLGLLSFANLPLVFLYAGRNNPLLWVTNWSHSTFLFLHRWIAAISTLEAILHSLIYLAVYVKEGKHATESKLPHWYWGVIATLSMTILFPTSIIPIRRKAYELFLAWHVSVVILVIAGCYWHIVFNFGHRRGHEVWIIACMAIWAFDRVVRVLRVARNGVRHARIKTIDSEYVRVTIPGVSAEGIAYLYFPTLTWRVWENHPFSIAYSTLASAQQRAQSTTTTHTESDIEKDPDAVQPTASQTSLVMNHALRMTYLWDDPPQDGITFYVRIRTGLTSRLAGRNYLPVLIESGYPSHPPLAQSPHKSPTLVVIAGGVGITAALPYLSSHPGRCKLFWGCRTQALVDDVQRRVSLSSVEKAIYVGKRMSVRDALESELFGASTEVCVLVSGPETLIDEVRTIYLDILSRGPGLRARLILESFSW